MKAVLIAMLVIVVPISSSTQNVPTQAEPSTIDTLAREVASDAVSSLGRARKLVEWINQNFTWNSTDYQQRTPEQIIAQRGGNCAELARVLARLLGPAGVPYRWVSEINIQPYSAQRQKNAEQLVERVGLRGSVFGARHNDHRWLEVYDDTTKTWVPADPALGVTGVQGWIRMRMALEHRPGPAVAATAEIAHSMIVPFVVFVTPREKTDSIENRTEFYVIHQFNAVYEGKLSSLPAWQGWVSGVRRLSGAAIEAFQGRTNLHDSTEEIRRLSETFEQLRKEARERGIVVVEAPIGN